jgi:hypothetical protein
LPLVLVQQEPTELGTALLAQQVLYSILPPLVEVVVLVLQIQIMLVAHQVVATLAVSVLVMQAVVVQVTVP